MTSRPTRGPTSRRANPRALTWAPIAVALLAIVAYANGVAAGWTSDDQYIIVGNPLVHRASVVWGAFTHPYWPSGLGWGQYRPLPILGYALDWAVSGGAPWWFHLANLCWHAAAAVLVWRLAVALVGETGGLVAAALFAIHPVHVEAVASVVGRSELMMTVSVVAGLLAHRRGNRSAILWAALAVACKENGAVFIALALAHDALVAPGDGAAHARLADRLRERRPLYVGYGLVLAGYAVVLAALFHGHELAEPALLWVGMPASHRWLTMLALVPEYVRLLAVPLRLQIDYGPGIVAEQTSVTLAVVTGALMLAALLALAVLSRRRAPVVAFGLVWVAISLAPIANVLFPSGVVLAERTLYLPSVGAALLAGWLVARVAAVRPRPALATVAAVGVVLAARTWTRTPLWHDNKRLIVESLADEPNSYHLHVLAATVISLSGHWAEAAPQYREARAIYARDATSYRGGAECAIFVRDYAGAASLLDSAIALTPGDPRPWLRLADLAAYQNDWRGVIPAARHAYALAPDSLRAVDLVRMAGARLGDTAVIDTTFRRALADHPANARLRLAYARILHQRGDTVAASRTAMPALGEVMHDAPSRAATQ